MRRTLHRRTGKGAVETVHQHERRTANGQECQRRLDQVAHISILQLSARIPGVERGAAVPVRTTPNPELETDACVCRASKTAQVDLSRRKWQVVRGGTLTGADGETGCPRPPMRRLLLHQRTAEWSRSHDVHLYSVLQYFGGVGLGWGVVGCVWVWWVGVLTTTSHQLVGKRSTPWAPPPCVGL